MLVKTLLVAHLLLIIFWLGTDVVVLALSLSVRRPTLPIQVRIDRARVAARVDRVVLWTFLLTWIVGIGLMRARGYPFFALDWLNIKHALYGLIVFMAVILLSVSGDTVKQLEEIAASPPNADELERKLYRRIVGFAPVVLAIYGCIIANIAVTIFAMTE